MRVAGAENIPNGEDLLNVMRQRNIKNTGKDHYNCAGYALGTFSWYCPDGSDYFETGKTLIETFSEMVDSILIGFAGKIRKITDVNELKENEYAIAFRAGTTDFHFAKRQKNGLWRHKMGGMSSIDFMKNEEVFSKDGWAGYWGDLKYTSELALFAMTE